MITSIYERKKNNKLKEKGLAIETLYYNVNQSNPKIYIRATDGKMLDNITDKAIKEKRYFLKNECIHIEKNFNPRIHYTIASYNDENEIIKCPNCGNTGKAIDFIDNCPYCETNFNFGINNNNVSKREKIYKITNPFFWIMYAIILIMTTIITTNTTSNFNPLTFIIVLICLSLPLLITCIIVLIIIKSIIAHINPNYNSLSKIDKKNIWKIDKNENTFYNDLYKEITAHLYQKKDLIDFDIIEYYGLEFISDEEIKISCKLKEISYTNKIICEKYNLNIIMKYKDSKKIKENYKTINCPGCGASIDISNKICNYCGRITNNNNEWNIEKIEEIKI